MRHYPLGGVCPTVKHIAEPVKNLKKIIIHPLLCPLQNPPNPTPNLAIMNKMGILCFS